MGYENEETTEEVAKWDKYTEQTIEMIRQITNKEYIEKIYYYVKAKYNRDNKAGR